MSEGLSVEDVKCLVGRLESVVQYIRDGGNHRAIAKLSVDISELKQVYEKFPEHLDSRYCWCQPSVEMVNGTAIVTHNDKH